MHRRLDIGPASSVGRSPVIRGSRSDGRHEHKRAVHLLGQSECLSGALPPLTYQPRPRRGIELPAGQTVGTNTGPGTLPFPTRPETILPDNLTSEFKNSLEEGPAGEFVWRYRGSDGELVYRYRPASGLLSDISAEWSGRGSGFQPCVAGGPYFATESPAGVAVPDRAHVSCVAYATANRWSRSGRWRTAAQRRGSLTRCGCGRSRSWWMWRARDRTFAELRVGKAVGVAEPRLVTLPYLAGAEQRPAMLVRGPGGSAAVRVRTAGPLPQQRVRILVCESGGRRRRDAERRRPVRAQDERRAEPDF